MLMVQTHSYVLLRLTAWAVTWAVLGWTEDNLKQHMRKSVRRVRKPSQSRDKEALSLPAGSKRRLSLYPCPITGLQAEASDRLLTGHHSEGHFSWFLYFATPFSRVCTCLHTHTHTEPCRTLWKVGEIIVAYGFTTNVLSSSMTENHVTPNAQKVLDALENVTISSSGLPLGWLS